MSTVTLPHCKKSIVRTKTIFLGYSGQIKQIEVSKKHLWKNTKIEFGKSTAFDKAQLSCHAHALGYKCILKRFSL